ncbi:hypothetical protein U9M48_037859 [Paspalum notatum var. saurae]|uniref:No apical meristem-associated C-terminal domain-containing protein n=1 Tax=Paspalum notatum var. saurae TaxID=547442 RepID=A0AAQ3UGX1_PASNO
MDNFWDNHTGAFDLNDDSQSHELGGFGLNHDDVPLRSLLNINSSVPNTSFPRTVSCSSPIDLEAQFSPSPDPHHTSETVTPSSFDTQYRTPPSMLPRQSSPPRSSKAKGKKICEDTSQGFSHRTSNYTVEEDLCLISAFLNVSRDPIVGSNQSHDAYWDRITQYYQEHKTVTSHRNKKSLNQRWLTMSAAVSRFCGIKAQQDRLNESGKTEADRIVKSIAIFDTKNPKGKWSYTHCWEALRKTKKWEDYKIERGTQKLKGLKLKTAEEGEAEPSDIPRPMGRDAAKKQRSASPSDHESQCIEVLQNIMSQRDGRHVEKEAAKEERHEHQKVKLQLLQKQTELQERQAELQLRHVVTVESKEKRKEFENDLRIMEIDTNTLSGARRDFYIQMQQSIVARMNKDADQGPSIS